AARRRGRETGRPARARHAAASARGQRSRGRLRRRRAVQRRDRPDRRLRRAHRARRRTRSRQLTEPEEGATVSSDYTELQLDAMRELANIGSGNAATALAQMLGQEVELSVPRALALPLADAVDAVGAADETVVSVMLPIVG